MNGLLRSSGREAHALLLRHGSLSNPSSTAARPYVRSRLLSSKFKEPSSASVYSPSLSSSAAAASSSYARTGFVSWYLGMIEARPVLTKSLTAGSIFTAADLTSQMITLSHSDSFDFMRTLRMAGYGTFLSGPSLHLWFNFVSRVLPKRDVVTTVKKMALGQLVYGPIMTGVFFSVNAALQGETPSEIFTRLRRDLIPTLKSGVVYWPICDFITFKFVPVRLQPPVSNSFSFLWSIYLTYMASLQKADVEKISTD
ncbi:protein SYM1-like [Zingiber officinale]|uniref:protein SYM1-like n=1 Tax=Zingiber officinale TaxID=94328 RepID=UPI001C4BED59|nr:protein SYM1-like [Zingiber officinale]